MSQSADLICRDRQIPAESLWVAVHRDDLIELCSRHGEDPDAVNWIEYDVIDTPLLRFGIFLTNDDGARYLACGCGGWFERRYPDGTTDLHEGHCTVATRTVEHALTGSLPDWWTPV